MRKINNNDKLMTVDQARKIMLENAKQIIETEKIELKKCEGRVLAEKITATFNVPEHHNSAVDGYAFCYKSVEKKIKKLKIIGISCPGKPFRGKLKENEAIKIYTGAYILDSKNNKIDTVCMEENCNIYGDFLELTKRPKRGGNIRLRGEDIKKNSIAFKKGKKIRSVDLAQLSSLGLKKIKVLKKLKVGIFSSGNELTKSTYNKKKFEIYDSNKPSLLNLFQKIGCDVYDLGIIQDDLNESKMKILKYIEKFDLILTSGGISKSKMDKIGKTLSEYGKFGFWRLAIKPGRPFAFGMIKGKPFIGLPGNPVAVIVTFFMLVIDFVKKLSGIKKNEIIERILPSNFSMKKKVGRREWLRGSIKIKKNKQVLEKFNTTGSGIISSISQSDGIIEIDEKKKNISKGTLLKFFRYEDMLN